MAWVIVQLVSADETLQEVAIGHSRKNRLVFQPEKGMGKEKYL